MGFLPWALDSEETVGVQDGRGVVPMKMQVWWSWLWILRQLMPGMRLGKVAVLLRSGPWALERGEMIGVQGGGAMVVMGGEVWWSLAMHYRRTDA